MTKFNSASRLLEIVTRGINNGTGEPTFIGWARVFDLPISRDRDDQLSTDVAAKLVALRQETQLLLKDMGALPIDQMVYARPLGHLERAASPLLLQTDWAQVRNYLSGELCLALQFCAQLLPQEEEPLAPEVLAGLREQLADFLDTLSRDETLSPHLRALARSHYELLSAALGDYLIRGASGLRDAAKRAAVDVTLAKEELEARKDSPTVAKLDKLWRSTNSAIDLALKAEKFSALMQKVWHLLS